MFRTLCFVVILASIKGSLLPTYLNKCSLAHERLWECLAREANTAIPKIAKGDPHYEIPCLSPLSMPDPIILRNDKNLKFILYDNLIHGLEDTLVSTMTFDGKILSIVMINPGLSVTGNYEINGYVLDENVFGHGTSNITLDKIIFRYNLSLPTKVRNGEKFFDPKEDSTIFQYENLETIYCLDDLYGGAKYLGDQMNKFMTKNWNKIQPLFQPSVSKVMKSVMTTVMKGIFNNVPIKEIFMV